MRARGTARAADGRRRRAARAAGVRWTSRRADEGQSGGRARGRARPEHARSLGGETSEPGAPDGDAPVQLRASAASADGGGERDAGGAALRQESRGGAEHRVGRARGEGGGERLGQGEDVRDGRVVAQAGDDDAVLARVRGKSEKGAEYV